MRLINTSAKGTISVSEQIFVAPHYLLLDVEALSLESTNHCDISNHSAVTISEAIA